MRLVEKPQGDPVTAANRGSDTRPVVAALRVHVTWEEFGRLVMLRNGSSYGSGSLVWHEHDLVLGKFLTREEIDRVQAYVKRSGYLPELVPHRDPPIRRLEP